MLSCCPLLPCCGCHELHLTWLPRHDLTLNCESGWTISPLGYFCQGVLLQQQDKKPRQVLRLNGTKFKVRPSTGSSLWPWTQLNVELCSNHLPRRHSTSFVMDWAQFEPYLICFPRILCSLLLNPLCRWCQSFEPLRDSSKSPWSFTQQALDTYSIPGALWDTHGDEARIDSLGDQTCEPSESKLPGKPEPAVNAPLSSWALSASLLEKRSQSGDLLRNRYHRLKIKKSLKETLGFLDAKKIMLYFQL